ncbi:protein SCAI-like [Corticium candelabrum]|uniref:protein SCAI-like n=1 Tax=Corticium candelabrum TaxID=121492 RepID=UPI002E269965|nr:protein SCAI-like [Corticium candelabrum]
MSLEEGRQIVGEQDQQAIVREFTYLLEKSKQLFNGIRDLPQFGQKQWQGYFARTFDVFTRLWRFQQQNRQTLDACFGLKRWQIGEIASKIGQLYYQYYMRTCETGYLQEAFSFYQAVRSRSYYANVLKEDRADLMVKKLRYYARFIVVCLLLPKLDVIVDLIKEMSKYVEEYVKKYESADKDDWKLVLQEVSSFLEANSLVTVVDVNSMPVAVTHRLDTSNQPTATAAGDSPTKRKSLILGEAFIVGNTTEQVKFSELTLDMFRMLQALERKPTQGCIDENSLDKNSANEDDSPVNVRNPHKFLLYKPTLLQLVNFISNGVKELHNQSVVLLYLSASGVEAQKANYEDGPYCHGGVSVKDFKHDDFTKKPPQLKETHCFYPGDLLPFTRRPMMLIVESGASQAFSSMPRLFGQPLICLLAPRNFPSTFQDTSRTGGLLTLFLYSPLIALCYVCGIADIRFSLWEQCQKHVKKTLLHVRNLILHSKEIDHSYIKFMDDMFLSELIVRFVFFMWVMRNHAGFKGPDFQPRCVPLLPEDDVISNSSVQSLMLELTLKLDVRSLFSL